MVPRIAQWLPPIECPEPNKYFDLGPCGIDQFCGSKILDHVPELFLIAKWGNGAEGHALHHFASAGQI